MAPAPKDLDEAVDVLTAALADVGIEIRGTSDHGQPAVQMGVDEFRVILRVKALSYCTGPWAASAVARADPDDPYIVVADKITAEARELLNTAGWSWMDRRGRLHLHGPGIRVDLDLPPQQVPPRPPERPVSGRSGLTVAYWLCAHPGQSLSPTRSAEGLRLAPSTISVTVRRLAEAGLVDEVGAGVQPELFWELAENWNPQWTWLIEAPEHRCPRSKDAEWRMSGTRAAAALGAPVVATETQPGQIYVLAPVEVTIALREHGLAKPGTGAAAVAVPPTSLVTAGVHEEAETVDGWRVAPLVAVALDLARDRARGREVLSGWDVGRGIWL